MTETQAGGKPAQSWTVFALLTVLLWVTHALGFFAHEYAHSTTAGLLGWKADPLALHYSHLTAVNVLAMFSIDENVDYAPNFVGGHGRQARIICRVRPWRAGC